MADCRRVIISVGPTYRMNSKLASNGAKSEGAEIAAEVLIFEGRYCKGVSPYVMTDPSKWNVRHSFVCVLSFLPRFCVMTGWVPLTQPAPAFRQQVDGPLSFLRGRRRGRVVGREVDGIESLKSMKSFRFRKNLKNLWKCGWHLV